MCVPFTNQDGAPSPRADRWQTREPKDLKGEAREHTSVTRPCGNREKWHRRSVPLRKSLKPISSSSPRLVDKPTNSLLRVGSRWKLDRMLSSIWSLMDRCEPYTFCKATLLNCTSFLANCIRSVQRGAWCYSRPIRFGGGGHTYVELTSLKGMHDGNIGLGRHGSGAFTQRVDFPTQNRYRGRLFEREKGPCWHEKEKVPSSSEGQDHHSPFCCLIVE